MRKLKIIVALCLVVGVVMGCTPKQEVNTTTDVSSESSTTVENTDETQPTGVAEVSGFDYSQIFDENGYIKGVSAVEHVKDLFAYDSFPVPSEIATVTEESIEEQIEAICNYYGLREQLTDREIVEGDLVSIDYVGSVDGVEFEGGNTEKQGTVVTAGSEEYIDDFLTQLIGHKPGETIDITVTFPEAYSNDASIDGKEAVFVTTINYILGKGNITDNDVVEYLSFSNGWSTVKEVEEGIRENLEKAQIQAYLANFVIEFAGTNVEKSSLPQDYIDYYDKVTVAYFQDAANRANMNFVDYLSTFEQVETEEALLAKKREDNDKATVNALVIQAVAESADIKVTEEDIQVYVEAITSETESLSEYEKQFGLPYIKQIVLQQKVIQYLYDNVVIE